MTAPFIPVGFSCRTFASAFLTGVLTLGTLLPVPGYAGDETARVQLRVSNLPMPDGTDPKEVAELRIQEEFLRRFPHVDLVRAEGIRLEGVVSEVTTVMMVTGGIAPDVMTMNFRSTDSFVQRGIVSSLDDLLSKETPEVQAAMLKRIPPQVMPVVYRTGPDGKKGLFGLPTAFYFTGLFFNRDLFQRAGLPPRPPQDWPELLSFAEKLKAVGPSVNPLFLNGGTSASWNLMNFLWSAGGEAVTESSSGEWRAVFDSPEAVSAYEFYYRLVEADRLARRSGSAPKGPELEQTGMLFGYVGDSIRFDPEKFGFGAVPKGPDGLRGAEINSSVLSIFSGIKDPDVRQAAWEYIMFMASPAAEKIRIETMVELGLANQVNPLMLRDYGFGAYVDLMPPGVEQAFQEALITGKPEPYGKNCNLVYSEMTYPLDQILLSSEIARLWRDRDMPAVRAEIKSILERAVKKTNERMLGYVAPETMALRRLVALTLVIVMALGFLFLGWHISKIFSQASRMTSQPLASKGILPWLFLAPALILVFVWKYLPLARGTTMAFQEYEIILPSHFIGLDNFANVLFDASFWNSLLATFHFALWTLSVGFVAPILLAYALHLIPRHKIFFRIIYYLPAIISAAAVFFLWKELFGADSGLNLILRWFGFEGRRAWTEDPNLAMISCVLPGIWAGVGPGCLIYLAALKTIPIEQFEAAEIDGAGFLAKTRLIIYPGLKALIIINFTGAVAAAFHGATNILIMTGGGPNGATEVTSLLIFFEAFTRLRLGHATAMAWILGSMLIGVTVLQLQRLSNMEFKTAK